MADVRSMLKASREARKINHPHASYGKDGKLLCNLCETFVKTESAWNSHLHSTQHTLRLSRAQDAVATRQANSNGKKRKASTIDSPSPEDRKKARPTNFTPGVDNDEAEQPESPVKAQPSQAEPTQSESTGDDGVNIAELEALNKELAELEASAQSDNAGYAQATISAPAMTAEEVAAQAREEQSAQRGKRDAELEDEREDAARLMEDEFEEMEGLEQRVKKLREKREALRSASITERQGAAAAEIESIEPEATKDAADEDDEDDDDEDDDEDFDDWKFGS